MDKHTLIAQGQEHSATAANSRCRTTYNDWSRVLLYDVAFRANIMAKELATEEDACRWILRGCPEGFELSCREVIHMIYLPIPKEMFN